MLTGNKFEKELFERFPDLSSIVNNITNDQTFSVEDPNGELTLKAVHTLGHIDDHMSFLLNGGGEEILFSGDIILGTPSSLVDDLSHFMETLKNLISIQPPIEWLCLPHSLHPTNKEGLIVPA
jgi:glyoxylase-like metal-dependent hydrolase (beta-lactamase superfamily II)